MKKIKFTDYDMRSDYEFQVYVSHELSLFDEITHHDKIQFIKAENQIAGTIIKKGKEVTLNLSHALVKSEPAKIINGNNKVLSDEEFGVLFATTWDGNIQFTIRRYTNIGSSSTSNFNSISYGDTGRYIVTDMSISSQFMLLNEVEQATYDIDMLQEWFSIYFPSMNFPQLKKAALMIDMIEFNGSQISLLVKGSTRNSSSKSEEHYFVNTNLLVLFSDPETRKNAFDLGIQLRNFFELILNKKLGLSKIILNQNKSLLDGVLRGPYDERENWYLAQSFLPSREPKTFVSFDINYDDIKTEFKSLLTKFIECKKLQDFVSKFLTVSQYKMPVVPVLLTLCSSVESYLSDIHFSDGTKVKNLKHKLKIVFNGNCNEKCSTKLIISQIKATRDFYVHGTESQSVLTETELMPVIEKFIEAVRVYILKELGLDINKTMTNN